MSEGNRKAADGAALWDWARSPVLEDLVAAAPEIDESDLAAYLDSLRRLQTMDLTRIHPGHGPVIDDPQALIAVCGDCHSENFARGELAKGDDLIREADHLLAEGIREIASLYEDGVIAKPESYAYAFPDLLTFHDAPTSIEQTLFEMHLKHRMRAFQGAFHANPDYALWYGWSEMVRDLQEIRERAAELRERHATGE